MKIFSVQIPRIVKSIAISTPLLFAPQALKAQQFEPVQDVFIKSQDNVQALEEEDSIFLSPEIKVGNDTIYPAMVVDLSENKLYHYDYDGCLRDVYPIASGKASTPTKPGLRIITHVEDYPYRKAGKSTKRRQNPNDYGPNVICLANIDMKTGKIIGCDGQFIHGTNKPSSIGKKVSKGCVRLDNDVIKMLAEYVSPDQYVLVRE